MKLLQHFKKQLCVFLCIMLLICLPSVVGIISHSDFEKIKNVSVNDNPPVWELGDTWSYNVNRFQANFSASGASISIDSTLNNLTTVVIGYSETSYIMGLSGKIKGYFEYESSEGMVLKGNLLLTKISGNLNFRQSDLANEKISIVIKGIVLLTKYPLSISIPIPIPMTITINVVQSTPRPFIDFPLYDGKQGLLNETIVSADIKFESIFLQILSLFFADVPSEITYHETFGVPMFDYTAEAENITVEAGTFNAYFIHFAQDLFGSIYYAPVVGNIIKSEIVIEIPDQFMVLFIGELISYNYK